MMPELTKLLIAVLVGLIGKIVWDWLVNLRKPIEKQHISPCEYVKFLENKFDGSQEEILSRLNRIESYIMNGKLINQ